MQGQFWLKSDMDALGQFGPIPVMANREVTGTFTVKIIERINHNDECESDESYSYNACIRKYVQTVTNCSIDVFSNNFSCTPSGLLDLYDILDKIKLSSKKSTSELTGCLTKCTNYKFDFELTEDEDASVWKKDWISSFYLTTKSTKYPTLREKYTFDEQVLNTTIRDKDQHLTLTSRISLAPLAATSACFWGGPSCP